MKLIGLDTETIGGFCRLIGLSTKEHFIVRDLSDLLLFLRYYNGVSFLAYNADYDIQSMLKYLPKKEQLYLLQGLEVEYEGIKFLYYRRKFLKFNNNWIFDCYQYYNSKLSVAVEKFLHKKKGNVDTSNINEKNIYTKKVIEYCIKDAKLCYDLFKRMYDTLPKELQNVKPISTAFYSAKYFQKELMSNRIGGGVNAIARQAYHGGRFEIFTKGHFKKLYCYDIVSAYPYEICKLRSMEHFKSATHKDYLQDATYGFYYVKVDIEDKYVSPLVNKYKGLSLFSVGKYEGVITKAEYERIKDYPHEIISAFHIFAGSYLPFKNRMEKVFYRKCNDENKVVWKYLANSLYGKTCAAQKKYTKEAPIDNDILNVIEKDGRSYYKVEDITNSNFAYAAVITANTRLRLYDLIKKYGDKIVMVQTDSVISTVQLDLEINPTKLGAWSLQVWDEGYMVGSGVYFYRIGKDWFGKFRGFNFSGKKVEDILFSLLESNKCYVEFDVLKRYSIQEANRIHDDELANVIVNTTRKLNVNFDKKRIWLGKWDTGKELREKKISSIAVFIP